MRIWVRYGRQDSAMRSIYRGMRRRAHELGGLEVRLWTPSHPRFLLDGGWRPDGMIMIGRSSRAEQDRELLQIPGVHIEQTLNSLRRDEPPEGWPTLRLDDAAIGRLAADYLHGLGLRRLALLNQGWRGPQGSRSHGFLDRGQALGCQAVDCCEAVGYRAFDEQDAAGPRRLVAYLQTMERPFGLYATSDALAELAVDYCRLAGLGVPKEVAVLGTGDDPLHAPDASVPLSSVHLALASLGALAIDHLATVLMRAGHPAGNMAVRRITTPERGRVPDPLPPLGITERRSTAGTYAEDPLVQAAARLILEDREHELTVEGMAERLQVSSATLFRHCRRVWRCSPQQFLQRRRVRIAQRLLRDAPDLSLASIALRCGFSDQAAFTRSFRRHLGCTPGAYRHG